MFLLEMLAWIKGFQSGLLYASDTKLFGRDTSSIHSLGRLNGSAIDYELTRLAMKTLYYP